MKNQIFILRQGHTTIAITAVVDGSMLATIGRRSVQIPLSQNTWIVNSTNFLQAPAPTRWITRYVHTQLAHCHILHLESYRTNTSPRTEQAPNSAAAVSPPNPPPMPTDASGCASSPWKQWTSKKTPTSSGTT